MGIFGTNGSGQFPKAMQATITFNSGGTGNFAVGNTVTGSGFSATVVKWVAATYKLTVKKITGTPSGAITNGAGATWTVATTTATTVGSISVNTGGWNIRETAHGITRTKPAGSRTLVEVLFAQKGMATKRTDFATPPTFTLTGGAWSAATVYDVSLGDKVTFSVVSSEAVKIAPTVTFAIGVTGVGAKVASYAFSSADGLTHTFEYPVVAGDIGGTGFTVAAGNMTIGTGGQIADINGDSLYPTAVVAVGGTLAAKTGVTIQA